MKEFMLRAIHFLVIGVAGQANRTVQPNVAFTIDVATGKDLIARGAAELIREVEAEKVLALEPTPNAATSDPDPEPQDDTVTGDAQDSEGDSASADADAATGEIDLNELTVKQLLALAEEREVEIVKGANKAAIISALQAAVADDLIE